MSRITIFHTGDMHSRMTPAKAARLRELKDCAENAVLLDSGDAIWAGNILVRPGGEPVLELMNAAGYDAMAMGNREFHFAQFPFRSKVARAEFPVLCANIRSADGVDLPVTPSVVLERDSLRIGVFGLCVRMIPERSLGSWVSKYAFSDWFQCAADTVPRLRQEADLVVALTHLGIARDAHLAREVPGIDLICGGHTHVEVLEDSYPTPITHTGWYAHKAAKVVLEDSGALADWEILTLDQD